MRISDWSSDVCSSDLFTAARALQAHTPRRRPVASAESVEAEIVDFAPSARSGIALKDDPDLYEIVAAPGRRVAAAGLGSDERADRHGQVGPAFLTLNGGSDLSGKRVTEKVITAGAGHLEPRAPTSNRKRAVE